MKNKKLNSIKLPVFANSNDTENLKVYCLHELAQYNHVNRILSTYIRDHDKHLRSLTFEKCRIITYYISENRKYSESDKDLPELKELSDSFSLLNDLDISLINKFYIDKNLLVIKGIKRMMAGEILSHYQEQANIKNNTTLSIPTKLLPELSLEEKNHVQLRSAQLKMKYNKETKNTEISTPYTDNLIVKDNIFEKSVFNHVIISKSLKGLEIHFMKTDRPYLLSYKNGHQKDSYKSQKWFMKMSRGKAVNM